MIERYKKMVEESNDLLSISDILAKDAKYRKLLKEYEKNPYDASFYPISKGLFNLAVAEPKKLEEIDNEGDYTGIITTVSTRLACSGAIYISATNEDDRRIGILGKIEDEDDKMTMAFQKKGDTIYLVGQYIDQEDDSELINAQKQILRSIKMRLITSAHAVTPAGIFPALLESCFPNRLGFDITSDAEIDDKTFLFGPSKFLALVTVDENQENNLVEYLFSKDVPVMLLGHVTKGELRVDDFSFGYIGDFE